MNAIVVCVAGVFFFLSGLHVYWAVGGRWGTSAVAPTLEGSEVDALFRPPVAATFFVAMALSAAALLVLLRGGLLSLPIPEWIPHYGVWTLAVVFALRAIGEFRYVGFFKRVKSTRFAKMDTAFYSPLCLFLSVLSIVISLQL